MWNAASTSPRRRVLRFVHGALLLALALVPVTAALDSSSSETTRVPVQADARVDAGQPTANFGTSYLRVDGGSTPEESFLRFAVGDVGSVQRATLRVFSDSDTTEGFQVYTASNEWDEAGVSWSNRPARGALVADVGAVAEDTWAEIDVTSVVRAGGTYSFAFAPKSGRDGVDIESRETSPSPELVVQVAKPQERPADRDTEAPSAPGGLAKTSATETSISVSWTAAADNVAVTGYALFRNGTQVATATGTSYTFTGLACGTSYTLGVEAFDAAGNRSPRAQTIASTSACQAPPPPSGSVFYVSPSGSDSSPGTPSAPWRTIGKAMSTLRAGQTAYLRAGVYEENTSGGCDSGYNSLTWSASGTANDPITISGYPGEEGRVIVKTKIRMNGNNLRLQRFVSDRNHAYHAVDRGCTGDAHINIYGDDNEVFALEIRNSNMSAIYVSGAERVRIFRNWIHDNGTHPTQDHGIYFGSGVGGVIANNVIEDTIGYGIHMYSHPTGQTIIHNTVVGSGASGIVLATDGGDIVVANNIFAFNAQYGIKGDGCAGCWVDQNVVYGNARGAYYLPEPLTVYRSILADPLFVNRAGGDYHLQVGSPAIDRARTDLTRPYDFEGRSRPIGGGPDIGAYER